MVVRGDCNSALVFQYLSAILKVASTSLDGVHRVLPSAAGTTLSGTAYHKSLLLVRRQGSGAREGKARLRGGWGDIPQTDGQYTSLTCGDIQGTKCSLTWPGYFVTELNTIL